MPHDLPAESIRQAEEALQALRLEEALRLFGGARDSGCGVYDATVGIARTYIRMRRQSDATFATLAAIEMAPGRPDAHVALGALQFLSDDNDEAIESLNKAIELGAQSPEPHLTLAQVHSDSDDDEASAEALTRAREIIAELPDKRDRLRWSAMAWHVEAYTELGTGNDEQALEHAQQAIELAEANPHAACLAYSNMGIVETRRRHYDQAIELLDKAYALNPYFHRAGSALGRLLVIRGRADRAAEVLEKVLEHMPESDSSTVYAYASALRKARRREQAREQYAQALELGLSGPEAILARIHTLWLSKTGRYLAVGIAVIAVAAWLLLSDPSPQALTFVAIVAVILALQFTVGKRR